MPNRSLFARSVPAVLLAALALAQAAPAQQPQRTLKPRSGGRPTVATPTYASPGATPTPAPAARPANAKAAARYDEERLLAAHLLRRAGFGPSEADLNEVLRSGRTAYIDKQLNPSSVDDSALASHMLPQPRQPYDTYPRLQRWTSRMVYSRRQLQEKMTLVWHEHFATSLEKVGVARFMELQENLFRKQAFGKFPQLLADVTRDQAMLRWLDNNYNDGNATDDEGNPVPPNENYARELLQLFSMGVDKLNMDGSPVMQGGQPVPAYTEDDVKEVARALTGWRTGDDRRGKKSKFEPYLHDAENKTILGETVVGRQGKDGAREVEDVIAIIMRQQSVAPFISKSLIQKLATETPTPGYVSRVATVFQSSGGDIKMTVRAILTDSEFTSPAVLRSQYKTPLELFVGAVRGLGAEVRPDHYTLVETAYRAKHLVYFPPSVFSFYRPGDKASLVNTALVTIRDGAADAFVNSYDDVQWDAARMVQRNNLSTPEQVVDYLVDVLLVADLQPEVRDEIVAYMDGEVNEETVRGAAWLLLCSPDYQRN